MEASPLGHLPRELRDIIWEEAVRRPGKFVLDIDGNRNFELLRKRSRKHSLALTGVCKQTRRESTSLIYSMNTFVLKTFALGTAMIAGKQRDPARKVGLALRVKKAVLAAALDKWLACVGSIGAANLRHCMIDLGTLDVSTPRGTQHDAIAASTVGVFVRNSLLQRSLANCKVSLQMTISTPPTPTIEEICVPFDSPGTAGHTVKTFFDKKIAQLKRQYDQASDSSRSILVAILVSKRDTHFAQQRLLQFVKIATGTPSS